MGCANDFELAEDIIQFWLLDGIDHWQEKAVELMRQPVNIRAVDMLATHVLEHITLDADYVDVLVEVADGNTTEVEFQRYLELRAAREARSPRPIQP
jgi:hypothetical protein